jgi:hypothetical protein
MPQHHHHSSHALPSKNISDATFITIIILLSESPHLAPPPAHEILRRDIDAQLAQRPRRQVAVVRPLNGGVGVVALRVGRHALERKAHDLREQLAHLPLGVPILGREL